MDNKINANPTKEFFISMLTRDIDIKAAISELVDNSIDGAKKARKDHNYDGLFIKILLEANKFVIEDNCGGMSIDEARNYAFRFGRDPKKPITETGVFTSVFGIGMKRSLFRMGRQFRIESTTLTEKFVINVNVDTWVADTNSDWTFEFSEIQENLQNTPEECGTKIIVTNLYEGISKTFTLGYFINDLRKHIERFKTIVADNGMEISINGINITFVADKVVDSALVKPFVKRYNIGKMKISIIAGAAPKGEPAKSGWYIYCNGRLVVFADKTELTGWGIEGVKQYHPSMAFFRGYVFYESMELNELPWNTTKTGVDTSSRYYIATLPEMKIATKQLQDFYNYVSNIEDLSDPISHYVNENSLQEINYSYLQTATNKNFYYKAVDSKPAERYTRITFSKPEKIIDEIKKNSGLKTNKEVAELIFNYYYSREFEDYE